MPFCHVCNKDKICENFSTIGNQTVCCLSCVGLLKSNKDDACACCQRPVWKDNYYEVNNSFVCSEKCKNAIKETLIKEKGVEYVKFKHFNEQKYYSTPKNKEFDDLKEEKEEKEEKKENIIKQKNIPFDPEQSNNDICNIINEMDDKKDSIEKDDKIIKNDIIEENENNDKIYKNDNNDKYNQNAFDDKNNNNFDNNDSSNIKDSSNNKELSNIKDISNIKDSSNIKDNNEKIGKIDSNYSINNNNESNDNNNNIDSNENNDWNKNSFIQKEFDNNENSLPKEEMKMIYKIEKSSHRKKAREIKEFFCDEIKRGNKKENEKESIIKSMKKYFTENKNQKLRRNQKSKIKMNFNLFNIEKIKKTENEINIQSSQNIFSIPNFSLTNSHSINVLKINEDNPFKNKIEKNSKNEKKMYEARSTTSLTLENSLNTTITKLNSNTILFNPVRKSEDIFKKNSYPVDSLTFPIDSLSLPNTNIKGSSINICNNCRKPILIRNSNTYKDFCSVACRNEYYNDL